MSPPSLAAGAGALPGAVAGAKGIVTVSPQAFQAALRSSTGAMCASGNVHDVRAALEELVTQGELFEVRTQEADAQLDDLGRDDIVDVGVDFDEEVDAPIDSAGTGDWDDAGSDTMQPKVGDDAPPLFELFLAGGHANFTPPAWIGNYAPRGGSGLGWGCLAVLAKRLVLLTTLAEWLQRERPLFVATFDLRHWAPDSLVALRADYVPNCLQKGLVQELNKLINDPNLELSDSYFSRMSNQCLLVHESGSSMPLSSLFSKRARTLWGASLVWRFMEDNHLSLDDLSRAEKRLKQKGVRTVAQEDDVGVTGMRLEEFVVFLHCRLARKTAVNDMIDATERMTKVEKGRQ